MTVQLADALVSITTLSIARDTSPNVINNYRMALRVLIFFITVLARQQVSDNPSTLPAVREALAYLKAYGVFAYQHANSLRTDFENAWAVVATDPALESFQTISVALPEQTKESFEDFIDFNFDLKFDIPSLILVVVLSRDICLGERACVAQRSLVIHRSLDDVLPRGKFSIDAASSDNGGADGALHFFEESSNEGHRARIPSHLVGQLEEIGLESMDIA